MSESVARLVTAFAGDVDLSALEPDSPRAFAFTRTLAAALIKESETQWWKDRVEHHPNRLAEEHLKLVRTFAGPDGLDTKKWKALPRKLELLANRVVERADSLAFQQYRMDQLSHNKVAAELLPQVNRLIRKAKADAAQEWNRPPQLTVNSPTAAANSVGRFSPKREPLTSEPPGRKGSSVLKFKELGSDMAVGGQQTGLQPNFGAANARRLRNMRSSFKSLLDRRSQLSQRCQQLLDTCIALDAPGASELIPMVGAAELDGHLSLTGISLQLAAAQALATVIPSYTHLTLLLPAVATLPLASVELISVDLRRQSWPALVAALVRPTQLSTLPQPPLPSYDTQAPSHKRLGWSLETPSQPTTPSASGAGGPPGRVSAAGRGPKLPLQDTTSGRLLGPNWWLTVKTLNLSGNTLGDQGLQVLLPHLISLHSLQQLSLQQAGLMDWSAPQIETLLLQAPLLASLDLSNNQMGPICAQAIAAALPHAPKLASLSLSWNTFGGMVKEIAWSMLGMARAERPGCLTHLDLAGNNLTHQDQMSLAALLRFGRSLPLRTLDLSYNDLTSVPGQCLLRETFSHPTQTGRRRSSQSTSADCVKVVLEGCMVSALTPASGSAQDTPPSTNIGSGARQAWSVGSSSAQQTDGPVGSSSPTQAAVRPGILSRQSSLRNAPMGQSSDGMRIPVVNRATNFLLDGANTPGRGAQASPNVNSAAAAAAVCRQLSTHSMRSAGESPATPELAADADPETDAEAAVIAAQIARFELDLSKHSSDRLLARLLVDQELHARSKRYTAWLGLELDGLVYRRDGQELVPFDVVYEGWSTDDGLPDSGQLVLTVRPVRERHCHWVPLIDEMHGS